MLEQEIRKDQWFAFCEKDRFGNCQYLFQEER